MKLKLIKHKTQDIVRCNNHNNNYHEEQEEEEDSEISSEPETDDELSSSSYSSSSSSSSSSDANGKDEYTADTAIITRTNTTSKTNYDNNNNNPKNKPQMKELNEVYNDTDSSSIIMDVNMNQEETKLNNDDDELKDMEEDLGEDETKLRGKYGELLAFNSKLKSFGIELTNDNKVAHKNHGNFSEDYVLLDIGEAMSQKSINPVRCWRFHHNSVNCSVLWGVVYKNGNDKYDHKKIWGCSTEDAYIRNGKYVYNEIKTEQWTGKLVDMMLDLNKGQLKFASPNFIEPKKSKSSKLLSTSSSLKSYKKLNDIIIIDGVPTNKEYCPILKLQHISSFVMCREIPITFFSKYPKAFKFDTFTHI